MTGSAWIASYLVLAASVVVLIAAYVRLERKLSRLAPDFQDLLQRRALQELESHVVELCGRDGRLAERRILAGMVPPTAISAAKMDRIVARLADALSGEPILITASSSTKEQQDTRVRVVASHSTGGPWRGPGIVALFDGTALLDATHVNRPAEEIFAHFDIFNHENDDGGQKPARRKQPMESRQMESEDAATTQ